MFLDHVLATGQQGGLCSTCCIYTADKQEIEREVVSSFCSMMDDTCWGLSLAAVLRAAFRGMRKLWVAGL